jgi:large subunit ribosomal protein L30
MAEVSLKQVRSSNGASPRQRETLRALKLGRIGKQSKLADTPQLRGMLSRVEHLVEIDGVAPARGVSSRAGQGGSG